MCWRACCSIALQSILKSQCPSTTISHHVLTFQKELCHVFACVLQSILKSQRPSICTLQSRNQADFSEIVHVSCVGESVPEQLLKVNALAQLPIQSRRTKNF